MLYMQAAQGQFPAHLSRPVSTSRYVAQQTGKKDLRLRASMVGKSLAKGPRFHCPGLQEWALSTARCGPIPPGPSGAFPWSGDVYTATDCLDLWSHQYQQSWVYGARAVAQGVGHLPCTHWLRMDHGSSPPSHMVPQPGAISERIARSNPWESLSVAQNENKRKKKKQSWV